MGMSSVMSIGFSMSLGRDSLYFRCLPNQGVCSVSDETLGISVHEALLWLAKLFDVLICMSPSCFRKKGIMAAKVFESMGKFGLALAVAGGVVNSALYNVDAGHRAVIFDRFSGVQDIVVGEGTHFLIPWVQKPQNVPVITGSKDLQNVNITLRILFRPVASLLPRIYTSISENYDERALPSITTEILKSVVARFDAGELIT
ncbi:prohibitin-like protein [Cricetulus griseus]|nr:prohibitin-like protein [Cricetulus griseus]